MGNDSKNERYADDLEIANKMIHILATQAANKEIKTIFLSDYIDELKAFLSQNLDELKKICENCTQRCKIQEICTKIENKIRRK